MNHTILSVVVLLLHLPPELEAAEHPSVLLAPGPAWACHTIDNTSKGADGVKLGDVNGDGRLDLVTGWEEGGEVRVYLNPGFERSREAWPRVTVGQVRSPEDAILVDLDGDSRLDVVSCTEGKTRTVYWHHRIGPAARQMDPATWSTDAFPVTRNSQSWMQAVAMDVDGEHGVDLILGSKNAGGTIGWLCSPASPGDPAAWQYIPLREAGWVMSLTLHDMDGDGDRDVVFSDRKGARSGVFWLENPGARANRQRASWTEHAISSLGRQVMFVDLADVNGDGLLDVAAAVKPAEVILSLGQPGGDWRELSIRLDTANLGDAKAVKVAEVNGDGRTDLFFTCENARGEREGIVWLEQQPNGPWRQHTLGGPRGLKYDLMQILDLDGDGDSDVITCEESDQLGVIWYENPHRGRRP